MTNESCDMRRESNLSAASIYTTEDGSTDRAALAWATVYRANATKPKIPMVIWLTTYRGVLRANRGSAARTGDIRVCQHCVHDSLTTKRNMVTCKEEKGSFNTQKRGRVGFLRR